MFYAVLYLASALYLIFFGCQLVLKLLLGEDGVAVKTGATVRSIEEGSVVAQVDGEEQVIPADTVLVALGRQGDAEAIAAWQGAAETVIAVGDCAEPRTIRNAIHTGARAALSL